MRFYLKNETEQIKQIIAESQDILAGFLSDDGVPVNLQETEKEGFSIAFSESGCSISYQRIPDLCRAILSLAAMEGKENTTEKCAFPDFGIMLDISRNAVLRVSAVKKMIRLAAYMGYRFVGLYMEDTYRVKKEPYFGYMRGALTSDEIREADTYARLFGIELRPFIQTLAHLEQITRYEEYSDIVDTDDILLVGDKRTEELLDHMLATISESFSSRKINIGMDEAHMVGLGKYLDRHGYEERFSIMQKHLNLVLSLCEKYGLHAQMWSDMFFRLAFNGEYYVEDATKLKELKIPEQVELGYWDYYSQDESHYDKMLKLHLQLTPHTAFAGGAWKWTGFAPHNRYSIEAGRAAISACKKNRIQSVTITCWGDNGAEASAFSVLPALYKDAQFAYDSKLEEQAFRILSGYSMDEFLLLDDANPYADDGKCHNNASKYLLYNDPLIGTFDSVLKDDTVQCFADTAEALKKIPDRGDFYYLFQTQAALCDVLTQKADFGKRIRTAYKAGNRQKLDFLAKTQAEELLEKLELFLQMFRKQWFLENKPFGFEVQTIRLGGLEQRIREVQKRILEYLSGQTDRIEELEEELLPFHYFNETKISSLNYNLWTDIVSPSKL